MANVQKALKRLHSLDAAEVSLVPKGANRRRFLITKSADEDEDGNMEVVEKGGPGSGRHKGDGAGKSSDEKIRDEAHANALAGKDVLSHTQSGKEIKSTGNKGERGWTPQDHMDAFNAHHEAGMAHNEAMHQNPAFQAARNVDPHMWKTPEQAAAIARDPAVRDSQSKSNAHHALADAHYAKAKGVKKSEDDYMGGEKSLAEKIAESDPETMEEVEECMKKFQALPAKVNKDDAQELAEMDDESRAAVRAVVRILTPMRDKLDPRLVHQVLDVAGYALNGDDDEDLEAEDASDEMGEKNASYKAIPSKVESAQDDVLKGYDCKTSDFHSAVEKANTVYKDTLAKLGYRKYPDAVMAQKTGAKPTKKEGEKVSKSDANPNDVLSGLTPEAREKVEAVFKSNTELVAKQAQLEARLAERDAADRKREIVAKAASFTHLSLSKDDVVKHLEAADKMGKESFDLVCKNFETLNESAKSSNLFKEVGYTAQGGSEGSNAWAQIETLAGNLVAKSSDGMTKEQAIDKVLQSKEGAALYAKHQAARPGGI